jgi:predicted RNase H-like nuclease (RuvC/YqgF family)
MSDQYLHHLRLLRADIVLLGAIISDLARVSDERNSHVEETLDRHAERLEQMTREFRADIAELKRHGAEFRAELRQIAARLRPTESRISAVLSATDYDRQEMRDLYQDLAERVSELEKRLGPPPAA